MGTNTEPETLKSFTAYILKLSLGMWKKRFFLNVHERNSPQFIVQQYLPNSFLMNTCIYFWDLACEKPLWDISLGMIEC